MSACWTIFLALPHLFSCLFLSINIIIIVSAFRYMITRSQRLSKILLSPSRLLVWEQRLSKLSRVIDSAKKGVASPLKGHTVGRYCAVRDRQGKLSGVVLDGKSLWCDGSIVDRFGLAIRDGIYQGQATCLEDLTDDQVESMVYDVLHSMDRQVDRALSFAREEKFVFLRSAHQLMTSCKAKLQFAQDLTQNRPGSSHDFVMELSYKTQEIFRVASFLSPRSFARTQDGGYKTIINCEGTLDKETLRRVLRACVEESNEGMTQQLHEILEDACQLLLTDPASTIGYAIDAGARIRASFAKST